jgi:hypothetical protein
MKLFSQNMRYLLLAILSLTMTPWLANAQQQNPLLTSVLPPNAVEIASVSDFFTKGEECYAGKMTNVYYLVLDEAALFWSKDSRNNCILSKLDLKGAKPGEEGSTCFITPELYQQLFTPWVRDATRNYDQDRKLNNQIMIQAKRAIYYCLSMAPVSTEAIKGILQAKQ